MRGEEWWWEWVGVWLKLDGPQVDACWSWVIDCGVWRIILLFYFCMCLKFSRRRREIGRERTNLIAIQGVKLGDWQQRWARGWGLASGVRVLKWVSVAFHAAGQYTRTQKPESSSSPPPPAPCLLPSSTPIAMWLWVCVNSESLPSVLLIQNEKLPAWLL